MNALTADGLWTPEVMTLSGPRQPNIEPRSTGYFGTVTTNRAGYLFVGELRATKEEAARDVLTWLETHPWKKGD